MRITSYSANFYLISPLIVIKFLFGGMDMFKNPGGKIQIVAWVLTILSFVIAVLMSIKPFWNSISAFDVLAAIYVLLKLIWVLIAIWIGGLLLFAFGDLVEDVAIIRGNTRKDDD